MGYLGKCSEKIKNIVEKKQVFYDRSLFFFVATHKTGLSSSTSFAKPPSVFDSEYVISTQPSVWFLRFS